MFRILFPKDLHSGNISTDFIEGMIVTKLLSAKIKKKTLVFPVIHVKLVFQSLSQSSSSFVRMNRMRPSFQTLTTSTSTFESTAFRESSFAGY